jgi:mono/diheme cytochrome c family protein
VNDPEVIAPGIREAPPSNERETAAIIAAMARLRGGSPPAVDEATRRVYVTLTQHCFECHLIDGVGGTEGPDLSKIGSKLDAGQIQRRIVDPFEVQFDAEMPAFGDKLSIDEIRAVAVWLAGRK